MEVHGTHKGPLSLLDLPTSLLETLCAGLSLRDRISLTSCCRELRNREGLLSSHALWGKLKLRCLPIEAPPLAAWLERRVEGLWALKLHLYDGATTPVVASSLALASGLTHLELVFAHSTLLRIPPCLASLPPAALVALEAPHCRPVGRGGASAVAVLRHCTALTRLILPDCCLQCLPADVLSSLPALAELDVRDNPDMQCGFEMELAHLTALTRLDAGLTPLCHVPQQLAALPALRSVALEREHLEQGQDADWEPLGTRLRSLELSSRHQPAAPERLSVLVGLQMLILEGSVHLGMPGSLYNALEPLLHLTALTWLSLCRCGARGGLPPQLSALGRLAYLDISMNVNMRPPESEAAYDPLRHLTALTLLAATGTPLGMLPPQLSACTRLAHLGLGSCRIAPRFHNTLQTLCHLPGLTSLDLRDCRLVQLPPQLSTCPALLWLVLDRNPGLGSSVSTAAFEALPHLTGLTCLSIEECGLGELPPQLSACTALRELWASGNQALGMGSAKGGGALEPLSHLVSLTELSLRSCRLERLPPQLSACPQLRVLDASGNGERIWCERALEVLRHLTALAKLDISARDGQGDVRLPKPLPPLLRELRAKGLRVHLM